MRPRVLARRARLDQQRPEWMALWWLVLAVLVLLFAAGCRQQMSGVDTGERPPQAEGTISGTVRGPANAGAVKGRIVEAVNLDTHERQRATTSSTGGFTFRVKPGRYRVELTLRQGETLVKQPGLLQVNRSDAGAHADFVIAARSGGAASRPRPVNPIDPGLGSPIA